MPKGKCVSVESPDTTVTIDFLSGRHRCRVTVRAEGNQLYVSAMADNEPECTIIADEAFDIPNCGRKR